MLELEHYYNLAYQNAIDIKEHLHTLKEYAEDCKTIVEFGLRSGYSTFALLAAKPEKLVSYDCVLSDSSAVDTLKALAKDNNLNFEFRYQSTTEIDPIEEAELLFIDTLHTYKQLSKELEIHGNKATKYIIFHDTQTFGHWSEDGTAKGLLDAIAEFININPHWKVSRQFFNNNGLTILSRQSI